MLLKKGFEKTKFNNLTRIKRTEKLGYFKTMETTQNHRDLKEKTMDVILMFVSNDVKQIYSLIL